MIKLLIGGSPCTFWSIAQKNNRETTASGIGWELFRNYLIAKEKFKPDFFLYENNKSAAQAIKDQIKHELNAVDYNPAEFTDQLCMFSCKNSARYIEINSALVSAQNRQRFYVHNCGDVQQPEDRGILLRDILETTSAAPAKMLSENEIDYMVRDSGNYSDRWTYLQKPGESEKALCITANISKGVPYNVCAEPVNVTDAGKSQTLKAQYGKNSVANFCCYTSTYGATGAAEPVRVGDLPNGNGEIGGSQATRIYSIDGKSVNLVSGGGGQGAKTGLYAVPSELAKEHTVYEVIDGKITIKGRQYPIKLADGYYIIRKLTVAECCRLQTMPDNYCRAVSDTQAYKGLGNGWTAEVIIHILNGALKNVPRDEEIVVLSMYDGIGTGRHCLDRMGFTNVRYYAYEIDKYAIQVANSNYPDIVQLGDAFQLRDDDWHLPNPCDNDKITEGD